MKKTHVSYLKSVYVGEGVKTFRQPLFFSISIDHLLDRNKGNAYFHNNFLYEKLYSTNFSPVDSHRGRRKLPRYFSLAFGLSFPFRIYDQNKNEEISSFASVWRTEVVSTPIVHLVVLSDPVLLSHDQFLYK